MDSCGDESGRKLARSCEPDRRTRRLLSTKPGTVFSLEGHETVRRGQTRAGCARDDARAVGTLEDKVEHQSAK